MVSQVPVLPPDVLARIYLLSTDIYAKFQLSRMSSLCHKLWKQDLVSNVGSLLLSHPVCNVKCTWQTRALKVKQDPLKELHLDCITLHVSFCAEALGQFLSLPKSHRRTVGRSLVRGLVTNVDEQGMLALHSNLFVSVCVQHDASFRPRDFVAMQDLLWDFPTHCFPLSHPDAPMAVDTQWWLWSSASPAKHAIPWCSGHALNAWCKSEPEPLEPLWLDSSTDFI